MFPVRVNFIRPTTYENGVPIPASEYEQTMVFYAPASTPTAKTLLAAAFSGSEVTGNLPAGDYLISTRVRCNIAGVGTVDSNDSPGVPFTVVAPAGDKPNPATGVVPVQL